MESFNSERKSKRTFHFGMFQIHLTACSRQPPPIPIQAYHTHINSQPLLRRLLPPSHPHYYTAANPVSQIPVPWAPQTKSYCCCTFLHTLKQTYSRNPLSSRLPLSPSRPPFPMFSPVNHPRYPCTPSIINTVSSLLLHALLG